MQFFLDKDKKSCNRKPRNEKPRKTRDYCIGDPREFKQRGFNTSTYLSFIWFTNNLSTINE